MKTRRKPVEVTSISFETVHQHIGHVVDLYRVKTKNTNSASFRTVTGVLDAVTYSIGTLTMSVAGVEYVFINGSKMLVY